MTKPIKIFSDTERQEIFDSYYNDTFTSAEKLQKHYGGSLSYMKRLIKDFESGKVDQLNQNQIDEIVNLYNNDNTITNISKETKISIKIISKVLDKLNLRKSNRDGEVIVGNAMSVDISGSNAYDKNVYNKIE